MNGYITVQEAAEKWGVTPRQVQILCKENRIVGAMRMSRIWLFLRMLKNRPIPNELQIRREEKSLLQRTLYKKQNIDLSSAP